MSRIILFLVILFYSAQSKAQIPLSKYYSQWIFGYDYFPDLGWGLNILDFNEGAVRLSHYDKGIAYGTGSGGALICDNTGQLSLISNGCHIRHSSSIISKHLYFAI